MRQNFKTAGDNAILFCFRGVMWGNQCHTYLVGSPENDQFHRDFFYLFIILFSGLHVSMYLAGNL